MSDTRHLDTAISILSGAGVAKRTRSFSVQVVVHHDPRKNNYLVQVGSRVVVEADGDRAAATKAGEDQAARLRSMGRRACVVVY